MSEVLRTHKMYACAYIDDFAVFSRGWQEDVEQLSMVLAKLEAAGLTINLEKCRFGQCKVKT